MVETQAGTQLAVDNTLDEHATSLRAYVDQQKAHLERLKEEMSAVQARISRGERAVAALSPPQPEESSPGKTGKAGKRKAATKSAAKQKAMNAQWVPSETLIQQTLEGMKQVDGEWGDLGVPIPRLAERIGISNETVKRALEALRERGEVRLLGFRKFPTATPGKNVRARAYALMPRSSSDELDEASEELRLSLTSTTEAVDG